MNDLYSQLKQKIYQSHFNFLIFIFIGIIASLAMVAYIYQIAVKTKAVGEAVVLTFDPASLVAPPGQDFAPMIKAKPPADMTIRGYLFDVMFDKTKMQVKDILYKMGGVSVGLGDDNSKLTTINQAGVIKIWGEITAATGLPLSSATEADVVTITFTSSSTDPSSILIDTVNGKFKKINTDYSFTDVPITSTGMSINGGAATPTAPVSGTLTAPVGGTSTLDMKVKFQGILSKPATSTLPVKVTLVYKNAEMIGSQTVTFTAGDGGIWTGSATFNGLNYARRFKMFFKGPKHLQKKICEIKAIETVQGSYRCKAESFIQLAEGVNPVDASGVFLLAGDLPAQDGIVDSYDISYVRNSLGKTDTKSLEVADLNLDGIVDTQDYSLVIAALSIRSDEEE